MKVAHHVIHSSVHGQFEKIFSPLNQPVSIASIQTTDQPPSSIAGFTSVTAGFREASPRLSNRRDKMLFYELLQGCDISVYVDANVRPINSLAPLFEAFEASGADIGMYRHYARSSVREEAAACLARNKVDNPEALEEELALYASSGFPDDQGMWEGSVIFRRHSSQRLAKAMGEWWDLYSRFQTRDQFSLPFVIWKHGLEVFDLDEHTPGREHYFVRLQHSEAGLKNRMARYLQARAPENKMWGALHRLLSRLNPR